MQAGIFDEDELKKEDALGRINWVELPEIDQLRKDELYELNPPDGSEKSPGQIRIMLQWIYSKVKLLNDILVALRYQIHRDKHDKLIKEALL